MSDKNILFSGLPASGKTTFIAALWYFIFNSVGDEDYTFDNLENAELEYLNSLSSDWAGCKDVVRTPQNKLENISIKIKGKNPGNSIHLQIPDISGEVFNSQFEHREWDEEFNGILEKSNGLILFIDPRDSHNVPRLMYKENQYYRIFENEPINDLPSQPWTEKLAPSQVKIVDFLQMIEMNSPRKVNKISVVVSCWDLVTNEPNPENWCLKNVPLLHQYLNSNNELYKVKYFGISSQGGSYDEETSKNELLEKDSMDRIIVTDGENTTNNILAPILWITDEY